MDELERRVLELLASACGDPRATREPDLDLYGEALEDAFGLELWPTRVKPEDTATPAKLVALVRGMLEETR